MKEKTEIQERFNQCKISCVDLFVMLVGESVCECVWMHVVYMEEDWTEKKSVWEEEGR